MVAEEEDAEVEVGFVEAGLEFEGSAVFGGGFGVFLLEGEREGEVEVGGEIGGVCGDGFAKKRLGLGGLVGVEEFEGFGEGVVGGLDQEKEGEEVGAWGRHMVLV